MNIPVPRWIIIGCVCLAFSAGFVDSIAVLGFVSTAVSHVTGTVTVASELLAKGKISDFLKVFFVILSFLFGAILSGIMIRDESLKLGRNYGSALLMEALFILLSYYFFRGNSFLGALFASVACGLQNALVATFSGTIIRTTHLTGVVTDLGSSLGMMLYKKEFDVSKLRLHFAILMSFSVGAFCATFAFMYCGFGALLISFFIVLSLGLFYIIYVTRLERNDLD